MSATTQILIAGFGGQCVLFAGKLLAYKGLMEDRQVSWLPSGEVLPERRRGIRKAAEGLLLFPSSRAAGAPPSRGPLPCRDPGGP